MLRVLIVTVVLVILTACAGSIQEDEDHARMVKTNVELSIGYLKKGDFEIALEKVNKALDADWNYADAHTAAAFIYERLDKFDDANRHYRLAIELLPTDGGVYNNYGVFLCKQKKYAEAVTYFLKATEMPRYTTPAQAYENAGACARRIPDLEKAEEYLRKALASDPNLPVALYEMAAISFEKDKPLSVRAYLQRYAEVASHTAESLWLGLRVERKLGDLQAAAQYARLLQTKFPKSIEFKKLLELDRRRAGS